MPFGNTAPPTCIYKYDVIGDPSPLEFVEDQLRLARLYRNRRIEIELSRRADVADRRRAACPGWEEIERRLADAESAVESVAAEIRRDNAAARRKRATPDQSRRLREALARCRDLRRQFKPLAEAFRSSPEYAAANAAASEAVKAAYTWASEELGLYHSTITAVGLSMQQAFKTPDLRFRKWDGSGRLCHQVKGVPLTWERAALGNDTRLRCVQADRRGGKPLVTVSVSQGGVGDAKRWFHADIVMHRPLPDGVKITNVYLTRRPAGVVSRRDVPTVQRVHQYQVCFVVARPDGFDKEHGHGGPVAVDVGWRKVDGGLRVAYFVGPEPLTVPPHMAQYLRLRGDGSEGELILPDEMLGAARKAEDLQSIRDQRFDATMAALGRYVACLESVPDWLQETARVLHLIQSKERLVNVVNAWQRHPGDERVWPVLAEYRRKEMHLRRWESDQRAKLQARRRWAYQNFWAVLRGVYSRAVVEDLDLAQMRRDRPADDNTPDRGEKEWRNLAAVGSLLELADGSLPTTRVKAADTTRTCHACGNLCDWDQVAELEHACEHCGVAFDQDENACRNFLKVEEVASETTERPSRDS